MNRDEARNILESTRAGGQDAAEPQVAEALRVADADPDLARAWAAQRAFDATMIAGTSSIPVPAHLKESILAGRKIIRPHFWQDWRTASAAAAAIALLVTGVIWFLRQDRENFAEFRRDLIAGHGSMYARLEFESGDMAKVRDYLAGEGAPGDFLLPPGLKQWQLLGCSVLRLEGQNVAMLGLGDGPRRLNLFVVHGAGFAELPASGTPDFEKCSGWKTASWRQGETTYVLTGLRLQTFVSKFRKSGRWTISDRGDGAASPRNESDRSG